MKEVTVFTILILTIYVTIITGILNTKINKLEDRIIYLENRQPEQTVILQGINKNTIKEQCKVTAYTNRIAETNNDPDNTAIMEKPVSGWTCAVSEDLMHWLGGRVYIKGVGVRRVNDLMNSRFKKAIDIYTGDHVYAKNFGKQEETVIYLGK